jgi:hypothetical protein
MVIELLNFLQNPIKIEIVDGSIFLEHRQWHFIHPFFSQTVHNSINSGSCNPLVILRRTVDFD